jgi:hypothetical protein
MTKYQRKFNRFELKYLLHYRQTEEFLASIGSHVRNDPNIGRGGYYKVVSRYYDSADLMCYWEKLDGEKYRRKVRVRTYGENPQEAFAEIKQRYNLTVQKRRCRAPLEVVEGEMRKMQQGTFNSRIDPVFNEIYNLRRRLQLEPKLIVSYNRAAFFDLYKSDLRVTVDRNFRCRSLDLRLDRQRMRGRWAIRPTYTVVEVKFNDTIPRWLCTVLNRLDVQIERVSKYCYAVEALGLHEKMPRSYGPLSEVRLGADAKGRIQPGSETGAGGSSPSR